MESSWANTVMIVGVAAAIAAVALAAIIKR